MIEQFRSTAATTRAFVRAHRRGFAATLVVAIAGWALLSARHSSERASAARAAMTPAPTIELGKVTHAPREGSHSTYRLDSSGCEGLPFAHGNCVKLEIVFRDHEVVDVPSAFPGLSAVPSGRHAEVTARLDVPSSSVGKFAITTFGQTDHVEAHRLTAAFDTIACGQHAVPTTVRVAPDQKGPTEQHVTLLLAPTLELTSPCVAQNPAPAAIP